MVLDQNLHVDRLTMFGQLAEGIDGDIQIELGALRATGVGTQRGGSTRGGSIHPLLDEIDAPLSLDLVAM